MFAPFIISALVVIVPVAPDLNSFDQVALTAPSPCTVKGFLWKSPGNPLYESVRSEAIDSAGILLSVVKLASK